MTLLTQQLFLTQPKAKTILWTGSGANKSIYSDFNTLLGSMIWTFGRNVVADKVLVDTVRGVQKTRYSNGTAAQTTETNMITKFTPTGFNIGNNSTVNTNGSTYGAWAFKKFKGFFDIIYATGNSGSSQTLTHTAGTVGMAFVCDMDNASDIYVYHRSLGAGSYLKLNDTDAAAASSTVWSNTSPTSTTLTVGDEIINGANNIWAAVFGHDANGIYCDTFTTNGSGAASVEDAGFYPKRGIFKRSDGTGPWIMLDRERGWGDSDAVTNADSTDVESTATNYGVPTVAGFTFANGGANVDYIYMVEG